MITVIKQWKMRNGKWKMNKQPFMIVFLLLAWVLIGCATATYPAPNPSAPPAPLPGQSAADAQATLAAWNLQQQATTEGYRQATAVAQSATSVAIQATEQAQVIATGTAQAELSARQATSDALAFQGTAQALVFEVTRQYISLSATATSEAQQAAVVAALQADEAARLAQQRQEEQIRQERARLLNLYLPIFFIASFLLAAIAIGVFVYDRLTKNKPVTIIHDNRQVTVLPDGNGGFRMLPPLRQVTTPALPAPQKGELVDEEDVVDGDFESVLDVLQDEQAILVHGAKKTGKTTLLLWLMAQRQNAVIVDPHGAPGKWPNCHMVGAGRDFDQIGLALQRIEALMTLRYDEIGQGVVVEGTHEKLTLFVDEYRAIVQNVPQARQIIATLLTEARKANIDIVLVSHSRNVKALGLDGEGDLREGFAFVHIAMVRGQRRAHVVYGMDDETATPVGLPGRFDSRVRPTYPNNRAAKILQLVPEPVTLTAPEGIATEWGFVSSNEVWQMLSLSASNTTRLGRELRRSIANELFGGEEGAAYMRLKYVLDLAAQSGRPVNDVDGRYHYVMQVGGNGNRTGEDRSNGNGDDGHDYAVDSLPFALPLDVKSTPTRRQLEYMRQLYDGGRGMSKSAICAHVYGFKNGNTYERVQQAIEGQCVR